MKVIFGTTNERKVKDLQNIINLVNFDIQVLSMNDIGWDRGDIIEDGDTILENSLIKAKALYEFSRDNNISYPIITDDSGLFCEYLNGEPGIYTARYADDELMLDSSLPKHQSVFKLLRKLNGVKNRRAAYKCCVTCMMPDGTYFQEFGESNGVIAEEIIGKLNKPYLYSVFILNGFDKAFSDLNSEELKCTYRHIALKKVLSKFNDGCR